MLISVYLILLYLVILVLVIGYAVYCGMCERIADENCKKYQDRIQSLQRNVSERDYEIGLMHNVIRSYERLEKILAKLEK